MGFEQEVQVQLEGKSGTKTERERERKYLSMINGSLYRRPKVRK